MASRSPQSTALRTTRQEPIPSPLDPTCDVCDDHEDLVEIMYGSHLHTRCWRAECGAALRDRYVDEPSLW